MRTAKTLIRLGAYTILMALSCAGLMSSSMNIIFADDNLMFLQQKQIQEQKKKKKKKDLTFHENYPYRTIGDNLHEISKPFPCENKTS